MASSCLEACNASHGQCESGTIELNVNGRQILQAVQTDEQEVYLAKIFKTLILP